MFYDDLLRRFTKMSREVLGDNLVGVYLHGSLAMDCFNPAKSDLDLILVVQNAIPDAVKLAFLQYVVKFNEEAPTKIWRHISPSLASTASFYSAKKSAAFSRRFRELPTSTAFGLTWKMPAKTS